jgi:uncharacterized protein YciI
VDSWIGELSFARATARAVRARRSPRDANSPMHQLIIVNMFVIELTYKAGLDRIDAHMTEHVKFLQKYYASGNFVVSGRKIPRDGGIIVAVGQSREEIEAIMKEDPFCKTNLADFRVIEFRASQRAPDMPKRIE